MHTSIAVALVAAPALVAPAPTHGSDAEDGDGSATSAPPESLFLPEDDGGTLRFYWDEALKFESNDGDFEGEFSGRIQTDFGWFTADDDLESVLDGGRGLDDGVEFRRARFGIEGELRERLVFRAEWDFADAADPAKFADVYVEMKGLPAVHKVRVGHFKEPFGLEELTSSRWITFLERSTGTEAFAPARNTGVMIGGPYVEERLTWHGGVFMPASDYGSAVSGRAEYDVTSRITGVPVWRDEGRDMVHVGLAAQLQSDSGTEIRYRSRPETHLVSRFVDTGAMPAEGAVKVGGEAAWVRGPFSLQGEAVLADVEGDQDNDPAFGDPTFFSWYAQASWFLTGEHRPYRRSSGTFDRPKPKRPFGEAGGWGALEVATRVSIIDLDDSSEGLGAASALQLDQRLTDFTLGVNWYLDTNFRVSANYVRAELDDDSLGGDEGADLFTMRFQATW